MKQEQEGKKSRNVWQIIGGIVFTIGMCMVMPKVIEKGSDYLYRKKQAHTKPKDGGDWNPEIVKKSTLEDAEDGEF